MAMENIENYLSSHASEPVVYIPNPGNAGDSIIATATYQLFDRIGLKYEMPRLGTFSPHGKTVVYGGGGNLVGMETYSAHVAAELHGAAKKFIILPHTISHVDDLLREFGSNVDIICRERQSFDYVSRTARGANVMLAGDMAFGLSTRELLENETDFEPLVELADYALEKSFLGRNVPTLNNVFRTFGLRKIQSDLARFENSDELYCIRTDGEKTDIKVPECNVDLPLVLAFGVENRRVAELATRKILRFLSKFKVIHTNRLHMAISGALLGLDVRLHPGSYYKCQAVYEFSMRDRFPNVHWCSP